MYVKLMRERDVIIPFGAFPAVSHCLTLIPELFWLYVTACLIEPIAIGGDSPSERRLGIPAFDSIIKGSC